MTDPTPTTQQYYQVNKWAFRGLIGVVVGACLLTIVNLMFTLSANENAHAAEKTSAELTHQLSEQGMNVNARKIAETAHVGGTHPSDVIVPLFWTMFIIILVLIVCFVAVKSYKKVRRALRSRSTSSSRRRSSRRI